MRRARLTLVRAGSQLVAALLLVGLSGCASGRPSGDATNASPGSSAASQTSSAPATKGSQTSAPTEPIKKPKKKKTNVIKWALGLGVGSPEGPAFDYLPSYTALSKGDCAAADDNEQNESLKYVVAAAKACQAAKGETSDPAAAWAAATAVRDSQPEPVSCVDAVVFVLLDSMVNAHAAHPDRQFSFVSAGGSQGEPQCPEITKVEPEAASAGDVVTLSGINLGEVTGVTLDGADVEVVKAEDAAVEVRVPETESEQIDLLVDSPRSQWQLVAHLKILQDGSGGG